jgi:hypothetical protein
MKPIHILLYEDNLTYRDSFKLKAQQKRIIVDATDNVDELLETLEGNPRKHKFVVLDARAYLHEGQKTGESEAYLHKIFREIKNIARKQERVLPYCVNTGFADIKLQYREVLDCPIFEKGQEDDLIQYIWDTYNNTEGARLRAKYPELFEFADLYFDDASLQLLTALLDKNKYESNYTVDKVDNLSRLRRLNEHLMDILRIEYLFVDLNQITGNAARRTVEIIEYCKNLPNEKVPGHIINSIRDIYYTCSEYGSHSVEQATATKDYPTQYDIIGMTNGFLGTVIWLKNKLG